MLRAAARDHLVSQVQVGQVRPQAPVGGAGQRDEVVNDHRGMRGVAFPALDPVDRVPARTPAIAAAQEELRSGRRAVAGQVMPPAGVGAHVAQLAPAGPLVDSGEQFPRRGRVDHYQWVDLDGEGLSGILTRQGGAWYYKANLGDGRFAPLRAQPAQPITGDDAFSWYPSLGYEGFGAARRACHPWGEEQGPG